MTVLLADNERLKAQYESLQKEKATVTQEKTELETSLRTDYVLR